MRRLSAFLLALALTGPVNAAQTRATAEYMISIAGLEIGALAVNYEENGGTYALSFDGGFRFLFIAGAAEGEVSGARNDDGFAPDHYRMRFDGPTREVVSKIDFADGRPNRWAIEPQPEPEWFEGRIPLADGDMPGAVDPVSAFLAPAASAVEACSRREKVFSGFVRYNLVLTPGAPEVDGVMPCDVAYQPVSGHRVDSEGAVQLRVGQGLEVSMAELTPGVWAPHFLGFRTPIGTLAFERRP